MKRGVLITVEGGEGAGKTTLIQRLAQEIHSRGYEVVTTREPGGTHLGEEIRQWLLNGKVAIGAKAELLLFLASRAQHLEELIKPALEAGKIILCDRFNDSTVAYQGMARGLDVDYVQDLCDQVCKDIKPTLTFFLDITPQQGLQRTRQRGQSGNDRMEAEKLDFHEKVVSGLRWLARKNPDRIVTLDANQTPEAVFAEARQHLDRVLP